ncbi:MAG: C39 family peptidase [Mycobacterium sp.]|uniref:C39 family peptidase n=1 Tax=Mycobacterium sp. TaxID=1785 RepID=UPI001EC362A6|nr:C39 family peptidase [Mycobacterium sp.]MBW0017429.1 C39 family peptidase [Mycobacterium sp.]
MTRASVRTAGIAVVLGGAGAALLVGFAGVAQAAPGAPAPHSTHGGGMYGDPAAAAPFWRRQHDSNCGEMAVADVVGQATGKEPTEQQIDSTAENISSVAHSGSVWHPGGSTNNQDLPVLLAHYGVKATTANSTTGALEQNLSQGRKVIVGVNSEILWNDRGNRTQEDHFVVVTGIDTKAGVVHLNDSGVNAGRDEQVPLATFESAWATSHNFSVVTS